MSSARRLALSRLASLTAGSAAYIALISAIYNETGSALWVSAALFAGVVGSVVGAPAAGWIGDRFERRRVMVVSDLTAAAVASAMALTVDSALALTLLFGILAVVESPFEPSSASAMPNLVPADSLPRANALVAATSSASYLLGPLLGGLLLGAGASAPQLAAAVFLLATGLVSLSTRAFPGWLAWASIAIAVWLLVPPIAWPALLYAFPLWLVVISVLLWTRPRTGSRPDPAHRTP
jgi:MFS family permease